MKKEIIEENWCYACGSPIYIHHHFCDKECFDCFWDLFNRDGEKASRAMGLITKLRTKHHLPHFVKPKAYAYQKNNFQDFTIKVGELT